MADKSKTQITEELRVSWSSAFLFIFFIFFLFNLWQTIHERWFVEYSNITVGGERLLADFHVEAIVIGLGIFLAVGIAFLVFRFKPTWRFITSMQLGVLLISSIGVGTILGTLVFQNAPAENYIAYYSEPMYTLFRAMHLTDVFDAWWFLALEVLLAISMITVTIRTKPWTLGRLGPMLIHLGIVVIIFGAFFGTVGHIDSVLFFAEGEDAEHAVRLDYAREVYKYPEALSQLRQRNLEGQDEEGRFLGQGIFKTDHIDIVPEEFKVDLGGTIRFKEFEEVYYEEPFSVSLLQKGTRKDIRTGRENIVVRTIPVLEFRDERPYVLKGGLGTLQIINVFENYSRRTGLKEVEGGESMALVSLADVSELRQDMIKNRRMETEVVLTEEMMEKPIYGQFNQFSVQPPGHAGSGTNYVFRLFYSWNRPEEQQMEQLGLTDARKPFRLTLTPAEGGQPIVMEIDQRERQRIPGTPYTAEVMEFYHHFTINQDETGVWQPRNVSQYMMNPALKVRVTGGSLEEPAILYVVSGLQSSRDKAMVDFIEKTGLSPDVSVQGLYDAMVVGETGELLIFRNGAIDNIVPIREEGFRFDFTSHKIRLLDAKESAEESIIEKTNDTEYGNYAIEVQIEQDGQKRSKIIQLMTRVNTFLDRSGRPFMEIRSFHKGEVISEFAMLDSRGEKNFDDPVIDRYFMRIDDKNELMFQVRGDYIKEWLSHLEVVEDGEVLREHTVRVNEPLIHNGFYYYQSSYEPVVSYGEKPHKWYTYLRVVHDPGLLYVFIGIGMMVIGMIWAAYIGPRFRKTSDKKIIKD